MSKATAITVQPSSGPGSTSMQLRSVKGSADKNKAPAIKSEIENLKADLKKIETKRRINYIVNGCASGFNAVKFIAEMAGSLSDSLREKLDLATGVVARIATGTQGFLLTTDTIKYKNLIPLTGFALEVPIAIFSKGDNLWLNRGISQGLGQLYSVMDRREVVDKDGEPVIKNNTMKLIGGKFTNRGYKESFLTLCNEVPKLIKELIQKPARIAKMSHSLFVVSVAQIFGSALALAGLTGIGATIRNISGACVDWSLISDRKPKIIKENDDETITVDAKHQTGKGLDFSSLNVWAGLTWITAAFADQFKHLPQAENIKPALTNLCLTSDRGASLLYTEENLRIRRDKIVSKLDSLKASEAKLSLSA